MSEQSRDNNQYCDSCNFKITTSSWRIKIPYSCNKFVSTEPHTFCSRLTKSEET